MTTRLARLLRHIAVGAGLINLAACALAVASADPVPFVVCLVAATYCGLAWLWLRHK